MGSLVALRSSSSTELGLGAVRPDGIIFRLKMLKSNTTLAAALLALAALGQTQQAAAGIPAGERQALVALYDATDGANWGNHSNWNGPGGTECTWYGVTCDAGGTTVQMLDLSWNDLSGSIPPEVGNLTGLAWLDLSFNQLLGSIPAELANLKSLDYLDLSFDQLSGPIPTELGNLARLTRLDLSHNQLTGPIAAEVASLYSLQYLDLSQNQLTGPIPLELAGLRNLRHLALSFNRFTGPIPIELGNLAELQGLSLSDNLLTGPIPAELGNLTKMWASLLLQSNQLSGSIPVELGNLTKLWGLFLYDNQLSGPIPTQLGNLSALAYLDLSRNRLSGSIPAEIGNLAKLQALYLHSNQLVGAVPESITNLSDVYAGQIDLSLNGLYSSDSRVVAFLERKQRNGDWRSTQTVPVTELAVGGSTASAVALTWTPIAYTGDTGGYQVLYATTSGGPYTLGGTTADKTAAGSTLTGLKAGTAYYVVVKSVTYPGASNQNTVVSDASLEVSAETPVNQIMRVRRHVTRAP